jgi:hypothetical protein
LIMEVTEVGGVGGGRVVGVVVLLVVLVFV